MGRVVDGQSIKGLTKVNTWQGENTFRGPWSGKVSLGGVYPLLDWSPKKSSKIINIFKKGGIGLLSWAEKVMKGTCQKGTYKGDRIKNQEEGGGSV